MLTGLVFGSWTFSCSLGFVVNVRYCTILINSSRGVTCDWLAEIFASARCWWACDRHQILATAWGACIPCDAPKWPFGFSSQPDSLWRGTSNWFRPKPLGLWHVMAKLIKIVQNPWGGKSWSHLNSSSWCVRLMGDGIGGKLETQEYFDVMEAGEEPWINEGSTKRGRDSPSEMVAGIGPEIGVVLLSIRATRNRLIGGLRHVRLSQIQRR